MILKVALKTICVFAHTNVNQSAAKEKKNPYSITHFGDYFILQKWVNLNKEIYHFNLEEQLPTVIVVIATLSTLQNCYQQLSGL